jgi:large subunit ribosomal protein L18
MKQRRDRTERRTARVRRAIRKNAHGRVRLSVHRSSKHIYAQVIDDTKGETLAAASSLEKTMREGLKSGANIDAAKAVGKLVAARARRGSRTSCSIAALISITAGSRRSPMQRAKLVSIFDWMTEHG